MKIDSSLSAIVTGGASGLGAACARALSKNGVKVAIFDLNERLGTALAEELSGVFIAVDVSSSASVAQGLITAREAIGQERVTINCAGIAPAQKTVSRGQAHEPDLFIKTININLIGSFHVASQSAAGMASLPELETGERGVIINTASIAAYDGQIGQIAYASSKAGVVGMTLAMARDLAQHGVRVMTIAPGIFETPMLEALPQEIKDSLGANVPFPSRLGSPTEFGNLALHICENSMLNGEVIRLDGAMRMPPK